MDCILKSFDDFVTQFPKSRIFGCLQLRLLLSGIFGSSISAPRAAELLGNVLMYYGKGQEGSAYYSMLTQSLCNASALKKTWERDDEDWDGICKNIQTASRNAKVRLVQFKIMHHF